MGAIQGIPSADGRFYPASQLPDVLDQVEKEAREWLKTVDNIKGNHPSREVVSLFKSQCLETERKLHRIQGILIVVPPQQGQVREKQPSQGEVPGRQPGQGEVPGKQLGQGLAAPRNTGASIRGPTERPARQNAQAGSKIDVQHQTGSQSKPDAYDIEALKAKNHEMQSQLESALEELERNAKTIEELNSETDILRLR